MFLSAFYIYHSQNQKSEINNNLSNNNTSNLQINKSKNNLQNPSNSNSNNNSNEDSSKNYYTPAKYNNNKHPHYNKKQSNKTHDEAMKAKKAVERNALDKGEIAGYPTFKDKDGSWLVPIYDKKTKKFKTSVYVYVEKGGCGFVLGPQTYSEYKNIIHGKTNSKSNEYYVVDNTSPNSTQKTIRIDIEGMANPNSQLNEPTYPNIDNEVNSNSGSQIPIIETNNGTNFTS